MKKEYMKPEMYIENCALSQAIAVGCGMPEDWGAPGQANKGSCGWQVPGTDKVIWPDTVICHNSLLGGIDTSGGQVCYNGPSPEMQVFNRS